MSGHDIRVLDFHGSNSTIEQLSHDGHITEVASAFRYTESFGECPGWKKQFRSLKNNPCDLISFAGIQT